jgi:hypothetical protein
MTAYRWVVEDCSYRTDNGKKHPHIDAEFVLRDCNHEIGFECFSTKRKHIKKHRKMIHKLVNTLLVFDGALAEMADEVMDDD